MMPADALEIVRDHDAILMGAVGDPTVPDHVSLWGLILDLRQRLDLWANVRPARLLDGIPCPLAGRGSGHVDMLFVRENSEGRVRRRRGAGPPDAADRGGDRVECFHPRWRRAHASDTRSSSRKTGAASSRARPSRTRRASATSSGTRSPWRWPRNIPASATSGCSSMRSQPGWCAPRTASTSSSLRTCSADILTDLAAAIQGGMGMAASANLAPGTDTPGLFEPVHGSAPGHRRPGHREPGGRDLERDAPARAPRRAGRPRPR